MTKEAELFLKRCDRKEKEAKRRLEVLNKNLVELSNDKTAIESYIWKNND